MMANILDDLKKPDEALKIYNDALKILDGDPKYIRHIAELHFNMGITYFRMNKLLEARNETKKAIELDYSRTSAHYILSELYYGSGYKVPALAAAIRFATLELNTERSKRASAIVMLVLAPAKRGEDGNIQIFLNLDAPKDEGDYGMYDLLLGTMGVVGKDNDSKPKTETEQLKDSLSTFISLLSQDKKITKTFVGKQYTGFLADLKAAGHLETLANLIRFQSGVGGDESKQWLTSNISKVTAMNKWAKDYRP
jgi:tetratricopeptide (TPR) repeat protein